MSKRGYKYIFKLFFHYLPLIIISITLAFVDSAGYTYVPLFIQYIISALETGIGDANLPAWLMNIFALGGTDVLRVVIYAAAGLCIYQILRALLKVVTGIFRSYLGERIAHNIRRSLYEHIQTLPYSYHNGADTGDLIQRCTSDIDMVKNFLSRQMPEIFSVLGVIIFAIYQMAQIHVSLTLVSLVIVPVAFTSSFIFCRYVQRKYEKIEESEAKLMTIMQENIAGVRVVKAFANEKHELDRFAVQNKDYADQNLRLNKVSSVYWGFSDATTMVQYMLTMVVAISIVSNNPSSISLAGVTAIMALVGSYIWPVRGLGRIIGDMGKCAVSAGRIYEVLSENSEYEVDGTERPVITGEIEFKDVTFKFDDTTNQLLKGISFKVKAGQTVAIVGKTGSGKSTIAKLLTRLSEYNDGEILLDGVNIKDIDKKYLRQNVGLVLQDPFLFSRTVYENIAITDKSIEPDKVRKAARISAIEHDISGFEKGYDTVVGEKGATLSGGQKQRVAIARMLLKEKPIVIFDDSLSALDTETDLMVRRALKEREHASTMLIITHRITTAKQADLIVVIEDGLISEIGTHDDLANKPGLYQKLWDIQGNLETEFLKMLSEGGANNA